MTELVDTQTKIQGVSLTPGAAQAAQAIMDEKKLEGFGLRIYVAGSGCSGVQFGMALDNNVREVDTTFVSNGVKVIVDEVSIDYLRGASVDFVDDPQRGAGFLVDSPYAKSLKGEGGDCACGGSCACSN